MKARDCYYRTGADPYPISPEFLRRLARFDDARIRLRWSVEKSKWIVERKVTHGIEYTHAIPETKRRMNWEARTWSTVPNDLYVAARDGYMIIDYIAPQPPPSDWLVRNLNASDIRRWGGSKNFVRKLEAYEQAREDRKIKAQRGRWRDLAADEYDVLKRAYGEQAFVPRNATGITKDAFAILPTEAS